MGAPSLSGCKELKISGDISFGEDVICEGRVNLIASHPVTIRNRLIAGEMNFDTM